MVVRPEGVERARARGIRGVSVEDTRGVVSWWAASTLLVGERARVVGPVSAVEGVVCAPPVLYPGRAGSLVVVKVQPPGLRGVGVVSMPAGRAAGFDVGTPAGGGLASAWERLSGMPGPLADRLVRRMRAWAVVTRLRPGEVVSWTTEAGQVVGVVAEVPVLSQRGGVPAVHVAVMPDRKRDPKVLSVVAMEADRVLVARMGAGR